MTAVSQKNYSILVVDDEQKVLKTFKLQFGDSFNILVSQTGKEALEILRTPRGSEIAVVIADQRMSAMTGIELLAQIKQFFPQVIRVLFTGYSDIEVLGSSINQAEIFKYIHKPYQREEIEAVLGASLQKYIEEKAKNTQLEEVTRLIQEKTSHAMENYTTWVAHHINNAIQSVYTFVQLAARRFNKDESEIEFGNTALQCVRRIREITHNLRTIYWDSLKDFREIALSELVDFEDEELQKAVHEKGIILKKEIEGGKTKVLASPTALQETLRRLVLNAIEASDKGRTVEVQAKPMDKNNMPAISFTIKDEGHGISEEVRRDLFFPIINVEKDNEKLAGLGLPFAKGMIARHGGEIELHSTLGEGTQVHFWIPLIKERAL
ncbi:MAG: hybrid sensor histidine kinase/response regulator [Chlamydiae bacterium]|nr:hybrid sensor histidine kinase/response regulator [Chlamydiota bacterium]MBI3266622.1 hybrid sensor histidine kinase/response regulator [Chlamydiota bacterium]